MQSRPKAAHSLSPVGVQAMNWNSYRIEDAVAVCLAQSKGVAEVQATVKGHMTRIGAILASWGAKLIVERKPGQVGSLLGGRCLYWHGICAGGGEGTSRERRME